MAKCPCYNCKDRTADCHGICELYLVWSDNLQKAKAEDNAIYFAYLHERDLRFIKRIGRK